MKTAYELEQMVKDYMAANPGWFPTVMPEVYIKDDGKPVLMITHEDAKLILKDEFEKELNNTQEGICEKSN